MHISHMSQMHLKMSRSVSSSVCFKLITAPFSASLTVRLQSSAREVRSGLRFTAFVMFVTYLVLYNNLTTITRWADFKNESS